MKRTFVLLIALSASGLWAAPALYNIKMLPAGSVPAIDGSMTEWTEDYFLDTLRSDSNVFYYSQNYAQPWTPSKFQMRLYAAYDAAKVYFAVKVTSDSVYYNCGPVNGFSDSCDNIKVNPGGQAVSFYIWANGNYYPNPRGSLSLGTNLWVCANPAGNGALPTYELAIKRSLSRFPSDTFKYCIGTEDVSDYKYVYAAIGVEYTGDKMTSGSPNSWDQPVFYPSFVFSGVQGPSIGVENRTVSMDSRISRLQAPNPFRPGMAITAFSEQKGALSLFNVRGIRVKTAPLDRGEKCLVWDGKDPSGRPLPTGIYIVQLENGKGKSSLKLLLER